jgi:hypothetical protein
MSERDLKRIQVLTEVFGRAAHSRKFFGLQSKKNLKVRYLMVQFVLVHNGGSSCNHNN